MKTYKIKKGNHYSAFHLSPFFKNKLSFTAEFSHSCIYDLGTIDQLDINKLMGFSRGFHHKNSARVGWRAKDNLLEIVTYCYVDGVRLPEEILGTVKPGEQFSCSIKDLGDIWLIQFKNKEQFSKFYIKKVKTTFWGYKLFPFFGGNMAAPHNMEIKIEINK